MARGIFLVFFLSGAAALIFETVWFRQTGLAFGNTVWAAALVMSAFMGGLALGNAIVAAHGHRVRSPLRLYAWMEMIVGASGIALVIVLPQLSSWLTPLYQSITDSPWTLNTVRLSIAFVLLLMPTTAMGVTLPLLVKDLSRIDPNFGRVLGRLYGWNTFGAVVGVLIAELVLVNLLGLRGAAMCALALNFGAAVLALRMASSMHSSKEVGLQTNLKSELLSMDGKRLLLAAALAGACMMSLEVVWFRFLSLFYAGTSLIFAIMLALVLLGISLGGLLAATVFGQSERAYYGVRQLMCFAGVATVLPYFVFEKVFYAAVFNVSNESVMTFVFFSAFLILPSAIASGAVFTLLGKAIRNTLADDTRSAGLLTFANTVGAMIGALVGGFVLLPFIGMEVAFLLIAACYGFGSMLIPGNIQPGGFIARYLTPLLLAVCLLLFPFGHMEKTLFSIVDAKVPVGERVAVREGLTETAMIYRTDYQGLPLHHTLATNGYSMSATHDAAKRYMKLYVYWPVALHPHPQDALLISYGVGSTASALTDTKSLQHIDIVDISREVLSLSDIIYPDSTSHPLRDERVNIHIEDGRFFLQTTEKRYDLITSEPPPPKISGVVNLYTQEYFELIHSRLQEGGMTTYWLPVHQLTEADTLSIVRGFCNAFQDCSLWAGAGLDWMLTGTRNAQDPVSDAHFSAQWNDPQVSKELKRLGLEHPAQLGSLFMADAHELNRMTQGRLPLTDNFPGRLSDELIDGNHYSEFYAALMNTDRARDSFMASQMIKTVWPASLREESLRYFEYQRMLTEHFSTAYRPQNRDYWQDLLVAFQETSLETLPLWMLGSSSKRQDILSELHQKGELPESATLGMGLQALVKRDYSQAVRHFKEHLTFSAGQPITAQHQVYLLALALDGKWDELERVQQRFSGSNDSQTQAFFRWLDESFH